MLYKPNFCCNCGETIDRAEQKWTDSSRFCDICKHDFVPQRVLPVMFAALMILLGLTGAAGFMRGTDKTVKVTARPPANSPPSGAPVNKTTPASVKGTFNAPNLAPVVRSPPVANDEFAVCGAMTKKGTPCTRRVRGGGRCWQHRGETTQSEASK